MQAEIEYLSAADPVLAAIIRRVGPCVLQKREATFETLARAIVSQQLSGKAAAAIFNRLQTRVGLRFRAAEVLAQSDEGLRECGLSGQKIASLRDLAEKVETREIVFRRLRYQPDDEIIAALCRVRGVGVWTAQMFLMFALQRPNILPIGDLGIRNAVQKAYGLGAVPTPAEVAAVGKRWHPYCTVASWYLWKSLDGGAEL